MKGNALKSLNLLIELSPKYTILLLFSLLKTFFLLLYSKYITKYKKDALIWRLGRY